MTFEEALTQIIEALQREKRISYRALQRRFALDDTYLDDLKEEIIYAKRLALDEDSRVLVWAGEAARRGAGPCFCSPCACRRPAEKGISHGTFTQGGAGASASAGEPCICTQPSEAAENRLTYRKLKFTDLTSMGAFT